MLCYDHSRVVLSQQDGDTATDYINANFVDGYRQKNAFISTQGMCKIMFADVIGLYKRCIQKVSIVWS